MDNGAREEKKGVSHAHTTRQNRLCTSGVLSRCVAAYSRTPYASVCVHHMNVPQYTTTQLDHWRLSLLCSSISPNTFILTPRGLTRPTHVQRTCNPTDLRPDTSTSPQTSSKVRCNAGRWKQHQWKWSRAVLNGKGKNCPEPGCTKSFRDRTQ